MNGRKSLAARIVPGAAMGLFLFFVLESAVARRIGPDLILPASGGAFLPGRLACLALVLALAVLTALKGQTLLQRLDAACSRDWVRWLLSTAVTALFFGWTLRVTVLNYMTMDDVTFLQAIARVPQEGLGVTDCVFSSQLLSWFLGKLYGLRPDGYWYLGFHLAVLLSSLTVIGRCVLVKISGRGWPAWTGCVIHGLLCAGVFMYSFAAIAFTVTPAVGGAAAAALMLCRGDVRSAAGRAVSDLGGVLLLFLAVLQRYRTGQVMLCFWGLAVAYQLIRLLVRRGDKWVRQAVCLTAGAVAAVVFLLWIDGVTLIPYNYDYQNAEYYRSMVVDFLNGALTEEQFAAAGIPRELATLIHGWFFMDQRVTTDLFRTLVNNYYAGLSGDGGAALSGLPWLLRLTADTFAQIRSDPQMLCRAGIALALLLGCVAAFFRLGRRYWPELLTALCAMGGAALMCLYLVRGGRFPTRVFLVVIYPAVTMLLLMFLSRPAGTDIPAGGRKPALAAMGLFGLAAAALCCVGAYLVPHAADDATRAEVFALQSSLEQYADANSDKLIISSVYDHENANTDPLHPISAYPDNLVQWGYCGDLAMPPEERMYADAFLRDDVQFVSNSYSTLLFLLQYLTVEYGPVQADLVTQLSPTVYITDIHAVSPGAGYTGWYEQNGMTYYFENGEALTGTHTIDGETYTFGPAGADAQLATVTGDTLIYTTDACALVTD